MVCINPASRPAAAALTSTMTWQVEQASEASQAPAAQHKGLQ
jgi:hypothetical protein